MPSARPNHGGRLGRDRQKSNRNGSAGPGWACGRDVRQGKCKGRGEMGMQGRGEPEGRAGIKENGGGGGGSFLWCFLRGS